MSQHEVHDVLKSKRLDGDDRYFTINFIMDKIMTGRRTGKYTGSYDFDSISKDCRRLRDWGILESKRMSEGVAYRLKRKCLFNE